MMRKAIITFGVGYGFEHIKHFVLSCKKFIPDTDIYMFAGKNIPQLEAARCSFYSVQGEFYREGNSQGTQQDALAAAKICAVPVSKMGTGPTKKNEN